VHPPPPKARFVPDSDSPWVASVSSSSRPPTVTHGFPSRRGRLPSHDAPIR
jgi:hypothetical protein